jgi:UDP-N-acetylmuramate dehydrogenase
MGFGYRHSNLGENGYIAIEAILELKKGDHDVIASQMKELLTKRNSKQPVTYPSAGSTFKRPTGHFAGQLIEDAGLKGVSIGGAEVSVLHSGFVINKGNATATDILELINLIQNRVYDETGIMLEPEVRIIG